MAVHVKASEYQTKEARAELSKFFTYGYFWAIILYCIILLQFISSPYTCVERYVILIKLLSSCPLSPPLPPEKNNNRNRINVIKVAQTYISISTWPDNDLCNVHWWFSLVTDELSTTWKRSYTSEAQARPCYILAFTSSCNSDSTAAASRPGGIADYLTFSADNGSRLLR